MWQAILVGEQRKSSIGVIGTVTKIRSGRVYFAFVSKNTGKQINLSISKDKWRGYRKVF